MSAAKGVSVKGTLQVGQGKETSTSFVTVIVPYGDTSKVDISIGSDGRNVCLRTDRKSAIALANRILDELVANEVHLVFGQEEYESQNIFEVYRSKEKAEARVEEYLKTAAKYWNYWTVAAKVEA